MKKKLLTGIVIIIIVAIILLEREQAPVIREEIAEVNVDKASLYQQAIEIENPTYFLNSKPFNLSDHIGEKVILLDIWTYSCINCIRTLPYITAWDETYKDQGLLIVGIHTPEFAFEKIPENVQKAIEEHGIKYPVVMDNDKGTWRAYKNRYWPRKYLIDIDGYIVYDKIGEGGYEKTETKIIELLEERAQRLGEKESIKKSNAEGINPEFSKVKTRELYFGHKFDRAQLGNPEGLKPNTLIEYTLPLQRQDNTPYLEGKWYVGEDASEIRSEKGKIYLNYEAKDVHIVAGSEEPVELIVKLDGEEHQTITIQEQKLYTLVEGEDYSKHSLELESTTGFNLFTFTFG